MPYRQLSRVVLSCLVLGSMALPLTAQETATQEKATPSAAEVIARSIEASGGKENYSKVKSLVAKGELSIPQAGLTGSLEVYQRADGAGLMKVEIPGVGDQQIGASKDTVWQASQITGAEILEGVRADQIRMELSVNAFALYEQLFDKSECTGVEEFEGQKCYVVRSQKGDNPPVTDYFSVENARHMGSQMTVESPMGKMKVVSVKSDFKSVGDFTFSHKAVTKLPNGMTQEVVIKSIDINADIPESTFALPEDVQALLK